MLAIDRSVSGGEIREVTWPGMSVWGGHTPCQSMPCDQFTGTKPLQGACTWLGTGYSGGLSANANAKSVH